MSKTPSSKAPAVSSITAKTIYKRLLKYAWRYKYLFAIGVVALIVVSATNTGFLATIKEVTDEGFVNKNSLKLHLLPLILFGLLAVRATAGFVSTLAVRTIAKRVVEDLRIDGFRALMHMPVSFFDVNSVGLLTSKLTYDAEQVAKASTSVAISAIRDSLTIVGMVGYMLYLDWKLTLIFATAVPFMAIYLRKSTPKIRAAGKAVNDTVGEITKAAEEAISGQRMVKIFDGEDYEVNRFSAAVIKNRVLHLKFNRRGLLNSFVIEILAGFALALVVFYATGRFTAGEFAAFLGALLMLIAPIKSLTSMNEDLQMGIASAQTVFGLIDGVVEEGQGKMEMHDVRGNIELRGLGLKYSGAKKAALSNLNFSVKAGEKIALVGRSGAGKTTLVNLLPRFYDIQTGMILLDGVDIRAVTIKSLRKQFALVSQDVILFNDTVFNNIAYGGLRDASEAEVIAAAKAAHAWDFIQQLPEGLQSEIGDRGVRLSGGQRQRLAIARAILKDAPILLLDEATSALDTESEQHVQAALDELMRNRTTIVIAHRLSTIENADRILVMEQGEVIESGTHAELLSAGGHYAKLYQKQFH